MNKTILPANNPLKDLFTPQNAKNPNIPDFPFEEVHEQFTRFGFVPVKPQKQNENN